MQFSKILSSLTFIAAAVASPYALDERGNKGLSSSVATTIVNSFASLLTSFDATVADNLLSSSFTDTSDSINWLGGYPLGGVTFPSKQAFIAGQGSQPPIGLTILAIDSFTPGGVITFRWVANVGSQQYAVKGINVLYASLKGKNCDKVGPDGWQLDTVYSEFNSAAWVVDIGGSCPSPAPPSKQ